MACDGEIHEDEITELQDLTENSIFFNGIDHDKELSIQVKDLKNHGNKAMSDFFDRLKSYDLSPIQKDHLLTVLIKIVKADNKIDNQEVAFLQKIREMFQIEDNEIIIKFPKDVKIFFKTFRNEINTKKPLENISFESLKHCNLTKE